MEIEPKMLSTIVAQEFKISEQGHQISLGMVALDVMTFCWLHSDPVRKWSPRVFFTNKFYNGYKNLVLWAMKQIPETLKVKIKHLQYIFTTKGCAAVLSRMCQNVDLYHNFTHSYPEYFLEIKKQIACFTMAVRLIKF